MLERDITNSENSTIEKKKLYFRNIGNLNVPCFSFLREKSVKC